MKRSKGEFPGRKELDKAQSWQELCLEVDIL